MWVGNVFSHACLSVCLSVQAITFELLDIETSFLVSRYILVKFEYQGHWVKVKVILEKMSFTYFNLLIICMWLQVINKVKVIHEGEGHIKVKVKYPYPFKFYVAHTLCKRVVCI